MQIGKMLGVPDRDVSVYAVVFFEICPEFQNGHAGDLRD
jgi:hypothetical protein